MTEEEIALLDCVNAPVFVLEPDEAGRLVYVAFNRSAREISGFSLEDVLGRTATELYDGRLGERAYEHHQRVSRSREAQTYELSLPLTKGEKAIRTTLEPVLDTDGNVVRLIGTSTDITAERAISDAQAGTELLLREIEQYIALAAHDLRSPMRRISLLADMLTEDFKDLGDGKLELIGMLENVATKAMALVTDVVAQARAMNLPPDRQIFDFRDMCTDIMVMLDPAGRHVCCVDNQRVEAEFHTIQIVIRNLIDNAIKHGGCERVEISLAAAEAADGMIELTISDNGKGFHDPSVVFKDTDKVRPGIGFGLPGIQHLVTSRGGTIVAVAPISGKGAFIRVLVPGRIVSDQEMADTLASNDADPAPDRRLTSQVDQ